MKTRRQAVLAICLIVAGVAVVAADQGGKGGQNGETRFKTSLAGAAIQGKAPTGHADFRSDNQGRMRLNVEVEDVNLPTGTVLTASIVQAGATTVAGTIKLTAGTGELELNSQDGDAVPAAQKGDMVTVSAGSTRILAGVF